MIRGRIYLWLINQTPPRAPLRNKGLIRPYEWKPTFKKPLIIRPYFWVYVGGVG